MEHLIEKARMAESCCRYEDMCQFMCNFVEESESALDEEQKELLSVGYRRLVRDIRTSLKIVQHLHKENRDPNDDVIIRNYANKILDELRSIVSDVITLIDKHLLPQSTNADSRVYFLKMKADYFRYVAEVAKNEEKKEYMEKSKNSYEVALKNVGEEKVQSPLSLGLALNYSVFLYEVEEDITTACSTATKALEKADSVLKEQLDDETNYDPNQINNLELLIKLLKDNIKIWSKEEEEREQEQEEEEGVDVIET